jgi:DNA replication protein DnaC
VEEEVKMYLEKKKVAVPKVSKKDQLLEQETLLTLKLLKDAETLGIEEAISNWRVSVGDLVYFKKLTTIKKSLENHLCLLTKKKEKETLLQSTSTIPSLFNFPFPKTKRGLINCQLLNHFLSKGCGFESLILAGISGAGKTLLSKSIGKAIQIEYQKCGVDADYLFVTAIDRLKVLNPNLHRVLIFDDVSLKDRNREEKIHLLCSSNESVDIRVRNINATLPPDLPRIFTTNDISNLINKPYPELLRRAIILFMDTPFVYPQERDEKNFYYVDPKNFFIYGLYPNQLKKEAINNFSNENVTNINTTINIHIHNNININISLADADNMYNSLEPEEEIRAWCQKHYEEAITLGLKYRSEEEDV